ncbi:MAG: MerR family transcriptional regulator [Cyanobacteria bacterium J06626_6]
MRISVLAKRSGLPVDTIRFYEKKGLLNPEWISRQSNNYREYSEDCVERLTLVCQAKRLGFTLAEIQKWIQDFESDCLTFQQKQTILGQKLTEIDERMEELKMMRQYLSEKIDSLSEPQKSM